MVPNVFYCVVSFSKLFGYLYRDKLKECPFSPNNTFKINFMLLKFEFSCGKITNDGNGIRRELFLI